MTEEDAVEQVRFWDKQLTVAARDVSRMRARRRSARIRLRDLGWSYRRIATLSNCTDSAIEKDVNHAH